MSEFRELMMLVFGLLMRHSAEAVGAVCLAGSLGMLGRQMRLNAGMRRRNRQTREELEAYARLDAQLPADGDVRVLGKRVCRVVADTSAFRKVAMLARDADGRLFVAGSVGVDDRAVAALNGWGGRVVALRGESEPLAGQAGVAVGTKSFAMRLEEVDRLGEFLGESERPVAMVAPLWTMGGRLVGALVVCADDRGKRGGGEMGPLEALAVKLARTMENAALADRLLRQEKLASLGQLAGGVAHALNNPLTAVLGFAELIAETTEEARVQKDAETIVREALRMRETVQSLLDFWRPATLIEEPVMMGALVSELVSACEETLAGRGVRLMVQVGEDVPAVRGSRDRLRTVMEHLLNNAAQAVGAAGGEEHAIRVSVTHDERGLQVIVSDTGAGFVEPARVFDPFYTTRELGQGAGLGLSICYGIVKEHGGEISAFNLHPRGAAVVVELPVAGVVVEESVVREVA